MDGEIGERLAYIERKLDTLLRKSERTTPEELALIEQTEGKLSYFMQENERLRQKLGLVGSDLERERSEVKSMRSQLSIANARAGAAGVDCNCVLCVGTRVAEATKAAQLKANEIVFGGVDMMPVEDGNKE